MKPVRPAAHPAEHAAHWSDCAYALRAVVYYRHWFVHWTGQRGASVPDWRKPRNCADAKYLAKAWQKRAHASRLQTLTWLKKQARTLHDFEMGRSYNAWILAVKEVQRAYPGTDGWLLSCSASEGGHGRWVPNSQGSGAGGWLQFMWGTWSGFYHHAADDVRARGFIVPSSSASWLSPLGQALAGAWGITHGMRHHWEGSGCW